MPLYYTTNNTDSSTLTTSSAPPSAGSATQGVCYVTVTTDDQEILEAPDERESSDEALVDAVEVDTKTRDVRRQAGWKDDTWRGKVLPRAPPALRSLVLYLAPMGARLDLEVARVIPLQGQNQETERPFTTER